MSQATVQRFPMMPRPDSDPEIDLSPWRPDSGTPLRAAGKYPGPIAFGPFTVDLATARMFRDRTEFPLRPQVFRVLQFLIQNPGRLIDYDEMLKGAWGGARVSRHTVAVTVNELRSALGEHGAWISIRPGYGYSLEIPESEHLMRVGQHFRNQATKAGLSNAIRCFEQVTASEGANGRAWEALAGLHLEVGFLCVRPTKELQKPYTNAYQRAVAAHGMTPRLQLDHALSFWLFHQQLAETENQLSKLIEAVPVFVEARVHLARLHFVRGRTDEAMEELRQVEQTDPLFAPLAFLKPRVLLCSREMDAAEASAKHAVALHPNAPVTHINYAEVLDAKGNAGAPAQYRLAMAMEPDAPWIRADEAACLARHGRLDEALEMLAHLEQDRQHEYVDAWHMALLMEALGRRDAAFAELERAWAEKSPRLAWLDCDSRSDPFRKDQRFVDLRDRVRSSSSVTSHSGA